MQIIQIDQDLGSEVAKELRDIDGKIGEFVERKVTAEDQLRRTDIRAPQTGIVFQSTVHTVGGVITAGETDHADRAGRRQTCRSRPRSIRRTSTSWRSVRQAVLRFSAFNLRTTPEIDGTVTRVSADTTTDQRTGAKLLHHPHRAAA